MSFENKLTVEHIKEILHDNKTIKEIFAPNPNIQLITNSSFNTCRYDENVESIQRRNNIIEYTTISYDEDD